MASFQLLSVDCYLLTKIINKMDGKSYFRLQQTNKVMNKFIHNNKHICVYLPESYRFYEVYFKNEERERRRYEMDVEWLYGVQFAKLRPFDNFFSSNPEKIKQNCDYLKKYRVTCEKLDLTYTCCRPSTEEIIMLINIVKPRIASIDTHHYRDDDADRCKALLQSGSTTLKEVHVSLDLDNTAALVPQLFSTFPCVHINSKMYDTEEQVKLLHTMLKILRSQSFPNLQNLSLWSYPDGEFPSSLAIEFDEVKEEFKDLNWTFERECEHDHGECKDQMENELDDLIWGCEEEDHDEDESEKEENEEIEKKEKEEDEEEINEDIDDDEEEDDDGYEFHREPYAVETLTAVLELPNGPYKMSGFDLLSLNPTLLEMVINKLDDNSYFFLQQANKVMNEFIRSNKNICVHVNGFYTFDRVYFENEERERRYYEMDVECLHGVRFSTLFPFYDFGGKTLDKYKQKFTLLKKYRVTCEKLDLTFLDGPSAEEFTMLINIVKPRIASYGGNLHNDLCKALIQSKTIKKVQVSLHLESMATLVPQLFSTFPSVYISHDATGQKELVCTMLKILHSQPFPNLRNFSICSFMRNRDPTEFDDLEKEFDYLNWIYEREVKDKMSGFDLLSLNPTLLEMVINKLDDISYFRLQKTNKLMYEFIHNSKNICVHLPVRFPLRQMYFKNEEIEKDYYDTDAECFYGVRFEQFPILSNLFSKNPEIFKQNCDYLKKYHITCEKWDLAWFRHLSPKEMSMLIDSTHPKIIENYNDAHYRLNEVAHLCKILLQSKTLKEVHVPLDLETTKTLVPQLFSTFPTVQISSQMHNTEEQIELFRTMLKILRSQSFPNLRNFWLWSDPIERAASTLAIADLKKRIYRLELDIYQR